MYMLQQLFEIRNKILRDYIYNKAQEMLVEIIKYRIFDFSQFGGVIIIFICLFTLEILESVEIMVTQNKFVFNSFLTKHFRPARF